MKRRAADALAEMSDAQLAGELAKRRRTESSVSSAVASESTLRRRDERIYALTGGTADAYDAQMAFHYATRPEQLLRVANLVTPQVQANEWGTTSDDVCYVLVQ